MPSKPYCFAALLLTFCSCAALSDESNPSTPRSQLIQAIQLRPRCDSNSVIAGLNKVDVDAEIIFQMIQSDCTGAWSDPSVQKKVQGNPAFVTAAEHIWKDWSEKIYPSAKSNVLARDPINQDELGNSIRALGVAGSIVDLFCKAKNEKACALDPKFKTEAPANISELEILSKSPASTQADDEMMRKTVSSPKAWRGYNSLNMQLVQILDGYAIFRDTENSNGINVAIQQKSLGEAMLQRGARLWYLPDCLKYISEVSASDQSGFAIKVRRFSAVKCPKK